MIEAAILIVVFLPVVPSISIMFLGYELEVGTSQYRCVLVQSCSNVTVMFHLNG